METLFSIQTAKIRWVNVNVWEKDRYFRALLQYRETIPSSVGPRWVVCREYGQHNVHQNMTISFDLIFDWPSERLQPKIIVVSIKFE